MKTVILKFLSTAAVWVFLFAIRSCSPMSEISEDSSSGFNGGFESVKNHLPVNWQVYSQKTTGKGDFTIHTDTLVRTEGHQSLKFTVNSCSPEGGRFSPGIAQELQAAPGAIYKISFWAKNHGCSFGLRAGAISATQGEMKLLLRADETIPNWKLFEYTIQIPAEYEKMRIEFSVYSKGIFYLDDIQIKAISQS